MYPVFIVDPFLVNDAKSGPNKTLFLLESLRDLDESLRARGSRLLVYRGHPVQLIPELAREWGVTDLCFEACFEPRGMKRDDSVTRRAEAAGVRVSAPVGHTMYDPRYLVDLNGGSAPLTMQSFTKLCDRAGDPPAPLDPPAGGLPPVPPGAPRTAAADAAVPSMADLGLEEPEGALRTPFRGGETEALARFERSFANKAWVCGFAKPETNPASFLEPATTVLSPYLTFGCLSARLFHQRLVAVYREAKGKHTVPPVSLRWVAALPRASPWPPSAPPPRTAHPTPPHATPPPCLAAGPRCCGGSTSVCAGPTSPGSTT